MVKCADCGYLAVRNKETHALVSPAREQRETGEAPPAPGAVERPIGTIPICAIGVCDLRRKVEEARRGMVGKPVIRDGEAPKAVIQKDHDCQRSTKWIPALSPKEHIDMDLLEKQQVWDDERDKRQQAWQEERDARNLRVNRWLVLAAVISALAALASAFFAGWSATHPTVITIPQPPHAQIGHSGDAVPSPPAPPAASQQPAGH